VLAREGRATEAVNEFLRALTLEPAQPTWHYNVALLLERERRMVEARQHLEAALALDPGLQAAREELARLGQR
jgi:Flp pilus assembly protein TadD